MPSVSSNNSHKLNFIHENGSKSNRYTNQSSNGSRGGSVQSFHGSRSLNSAFQGVMDTEYPHSQDSSTVATDVSHTSSNTAAVNSKMGTINGVFLPCIQNITGVILFLRLPYITAQAGAVGASSIVLLCALSTFLTSLSLSALATNGTIDAGGPYYIISRTLGAEVGGALGLMFYLGTTIATSMYVLGAVEALQHTGDYSQMMNNVVGMGTNYYEQGGYVAEAMTGQEAAGEVYAAEGGYGGEDIAGPPHLRRVLQEVAQAIVETAASAAYGAMNAENQPLPGQQMQQPMYPGPGEEVMVLPSVAQQAAYTPMDVAVPQMDLTETRITALILMLIITCTVSIGIKFVNLSSNLFLGIVLISITSFSVGIIMFGMDVTNGNLLDTDRLSMDNIWPHYEPNPTTGHTPTFSSLLALFYPSVTGIMAGSNRSAMLADPAVSIPRGTIAAITASTLLYLIVVWLFGCIVAHPTLIDNKLVVASVAFPTPLVVQIGIVVSCIGASLQTMAGAPQLLAAIAYDDAIPFLRILKPPSPDTYPIRAVWTTWAIATLATLPGQLDHVTPVVTMFFLLMYAGINLSCFCLGILRSPGFRPSFQYFHWSMSLLGFVLCVTLCLVISWVRAFFAILLFIALYLYNSHQSTVSANSSSNNTNISNTWGTIGESIRFNITTTTLKSFLDYEVNQTHAKNWRPQILTVVDCSKRGNPARPELLSLAAQLSTRGKGLNMVVSVMKGSYQDEEVCKSIVSVKKVLRLRMAEEGLDGFAEVVATQAEYSDAICAAVVNTGLGPVSPNTVLLAWPNTWRTNGNIAYDFVSTLRGITNMKKAVIVFKGNPQTYPSTKFDFVDNGIIDVWWIVDDGGLVLLIPYLLLMSPVWKKSGRCTSRIRLFVVLSNVMENPDRLEIAVARHLERARIKISSVRVVDMSETTIANDMRGAQRRIAGDSWKTVGETFDPDALLRQTHDMELQNNSNHNSSLEEEKRTITAKAFNRELVLNSSNANLIVTNLPLVSVMKNSSEFLSYVDTVCDTLENVLLVRGSGAQVITTAA